MGYRPVDSNWLIITTVHTYGAVRISKARKLSRFSYALPIQPLYFS